MFSVCDACCLLIYFRLLSARILGHTLVSFVFHVTVEPQLEEEQYEVAENNYEEEQDKRQYSEQGKPTSPPYNESYYFYQACFVSKIKECMFYFFCGTLPPKNYFTKYCLAKVIY